jgi:hypothetical protein
MRIRKKVLAFALFSTAMALLLIKTGALIPGIGLLFCSMGLHTIHIIMYMKKVP